MIIDLKAIPREGSRTYQFHLSGDWWDSRAGDEGQVLGIHTPLKVRIKVYRVRDKYVLEGFLEGILQISCDRCLERYHKEVKTDFRVVMIKPPPEMRESEIELLEEDMEVGFIKGEEIDLDGIIREQIFLSLPIKSLCREDCSGLCPVCGINLNSKECTCEKGSGRPVFSKLKYINRRRAEEKNGGTKKEKIKIKEGYEAIP